MPLLVPGPTDRFVILGPTGSGKTVAMQDMLRRVDDGDTLNVIVDPKHHLKPRKCDIIATTLRKLEAAMNTLRRRSEGDVIYHVPREHLLRKNAQELDHVAKLALDATWTRLVYDEVKYVASASDFEERAPNFYFSITTGRWSHVPVWMGAQRPSWIPLVVLSESDVRQTFYLRMRDDQRRAEELLGPVDWEALKFHSHSFAMATDQSERGPMRLALGKAA